MVMLRKFVDCSHVQLASFHLNSFFFCFTDNKPTLQFDSKLIVTSLCKPLYVKRVARAKPRARVDTEAKKIAFLEIFTQFSRSPLAVSCAQDSAHFLRSKIFPPHYNQETVNQSSSIFLSFTKKMKNKKKQGIQFEETSKLQTFRTIK